MRSYSNSSKRPSLAFKLALGTTCAVGSIVGFAYAATVNDQAHELWLQVIPKGEIILMKFKKESSETRDRISNIGGNVKWETFENAGKSVGEVVDSISKTLERSGGKATEIKGNLEESVKSAQKSIKETFHQGMQLVHDTNTRASETISSAQKTIGNGVESASKSISSILHTVEDFVGNQFYRYFCENNSGSSY